MTRSSALVGSAHHLHGVLDVAPLFRLIGFAPAFASLGLLGGLCDRRGTMLLEHLARDGVNLRFRDHVALLLFHGLKPRQPQRVRGSYQRLKTSGRSLKD